MTPLLRISTPRHMLEVIVDLVKWHPAQECNDKENSPVSISEKGVGTEHKEVQ